MRCAFVLSEKRLIRSMSSEVTAHSAMTLRDGVIIVEGMSDVVHKEAKRIASKWSAKLGTRTLDNLHVASALALQADALITFDQRQRTLAGAVGLRTSLQ
jgi:predicted nucleic acid-binding protein